MLQGHIFTQGGWTFEIKSIVATKGEEIVGIAIINIADGHLFIEELCCADFSVTDDKAMNIFKRIINGASFPLAGHIFTIGEWDFKIKSMVARKVPFYGGEYVGVANVGVFAGIVHVEALHCDDFTMTDYKDIRCFIDKGLGFSTFEYSRYSSDLKRKQVQK